MYEIGISLVSHGSVTKPAHSAVESIAHELLEADGLLILDLGWSARSYMTKSRTFPKDKLGKPSEFVTKRTRVKHQHFTTNEVFFATLKDLRYSWGEVLGIRDAAGAEPGTWSR